MIDNRKTFVSYSCSLSTRLFPVLKPKCSNEKEITLPYYCLHNISTYYVPDIFSHAYTQYISPLGFFIVLTPNKQLIQAHILLQEKKVYIVNESSNIFSKNSHEEHFLIIIQVLLKVLLMYLLL